MKKAILLLCFTVLASSCHYKKDQLLIRNNSNEQMCYETIINGKDGYYRVSAGGTVEAHAEDSPIRRSPIIGPLEENAAGHILYIVFYKPTHKFIIDNIKADNIDNIVKSGKVTISKYTLDELNKMKWVVQYPK
ncbi:hypothetical protein HYN48_04655 [Flavobacterium magnum]|uniref:Lipoprotein n=1 Tax=Flavobacterium magnum TaxID=2162713 RepID=A0A2S0RCF8_9FLAO|nr:hypothetical protein [Flavobacterium magnum]AWA29433.1 hypothetical protein HYN48_04655 [Flavobacterium magnum]